MAISFFLLAPYIAVEAAHALVAGDRAGTSVAGLAANTLWGAWWLDVVVALGIAGWAVVEGRRAWAGRSCDCASQPGPPCWPSSG